MLCSNFKINALFCNALRLERRKINRYGLLFSVRYIVINTEVNSASFGILTLILADNILDLRLKAVCYFVISNVAVLALCNGNVNFYCSDIIIIDDREISTAFNRPTGSL